MLTNILGNFLPSRYNVSLCLYTIKILNIYGSYTYACPQSYIGIYLNILFNY